MPACRCWKSLVANAIVVASALLASTTVAVARFDEGGFMSRDLAIGTHETIDPPGVAETIYATTFPENPGAGEATLWAFCTDATCAGVTDRIDSDLCKPPCKWRMPLPGAGAAASHAPPVVSADGERIFVASGNGRLYAYDRDGTLQWGGSYDAAGHSGSAETFYARPTLYEWGEPPDRKRIVVVVDWQGHGTSVVHLHIVKDIGFDNPGQPWLNRAAESNGDPDDDSTGLSGPPPWPCLVPGAPHRFQPIVDGSPDAPPERIYLAAGHADTGIYAVDASVQTCPAGGATVLWSFGKMDAASTPDFSSADTSFRLGGVIVDIDSHAPNPQMGRVLVANATNSTLAICLDDAPGCPEGTPLWLKHHSGSGPSRQTHRSLPVVSTTQRDPSQRGGCGGGEPVPVVYLQGQGSNLTRLDPRTGIDPCPPQTQAPFLPVGTDKSPPKTSFSSPVVSPRSGHVFTGAAHQKQPIFKYDPASPQRSAKKDLLSDYSKYGWLDYAPEDGWRTAAVFSNRNLRLHIGSAKSILYGIDADQPCGVVEWCYDTAAPAPHQAGDCRQAGPRAECCTALTDKSPKMDKLAWIAVFGPDALLDKRDALRGRRTATSCQTCRNAANRLVPCNGTAIVLPSEGPSHPLPGASSALVRANHVAPEGAIVTANPVPSRGEWMNETTGAYGALACDSASCESQVALDPSARNEIRVAIFDTFGNESFDRIVIDTRVSPP